MGVAEFKFNSINKDYKDILKDLEILILDINKEILKVKENGFIFTYNNKNKDSDLKRVDIDEMSFHIIHDFDGINVGLHPKSNNVNLDDFNRFSIYPNSDIEYFFKVSKEDDELIYSIRIFCIKNDNKEEDFFEKLNDWFIISSKIDYKCYLKTIVWDNTRKKKLKEAGYKCQLCSKTDAELHVHHNTYERIGNEDMNDLIVLCESCHKKFHNID